MKIEIISFLISAIFFLQLFPWFIAFDYNVIAVKSTLNEYFHVFSIVLIFESLGET